jgi:CpeT protein
MLQQVFHRWMYSVVIGAIALSPPTAIAQVPRETAVVEVSDRLIGIMETRTPPNRNGESVTVQMTTCEVQIVATDSQPDPSSRFLYQEQALVEELDQPYRQRFLQVLATADGQVESRSFRPRQPEPWVNFCSHQAERSVELADLLPSDCSVFLRQEGESYIGETPAAGCPTSFRGAVRVTNQIILNSTEMVTRDRGYDADGNLLWGAREEPYRYRKLGLLRN